MKRLALLAMAGCGTHAATPGTFATLRPACDAGTYWNGTACAPAGDAPAKIAAGTKALAEQQIEQAQRDLEAAGHGGPLGHADNITLWEQRGIADAYLDDVPGAKRAFDHLLALDPGHFLSCKTVSPKATFLFEEVRKQPGRVAPTLDVTWPRGRKVGDALPVDLEVVADPAHFLHRATVFVRQRGEARWRAADVALDAAPGTPAATRRLVLPPIVAHEPVSLELFVRAYDAHDNAVLTWASPTRPRDMALAYEPPTPWYRSWWAITAASGLLALGVGVTVYELTLAPPEKLTGMGHVP